MNCEEAEIEVTIRSEPRLLRAIRGMIRGYMENLSFSPEKIEEVVLAVDEACTNCIRHAYEGSNKEKFSLALRCAPEYVTIDLSDNGKPASAASLDKPMDTSPSLETLTPGGLGLHLIRNVFDEVIFQPGTTRGNRIIMKLRRTADHAE